jgi:hypothetical protein
MRSCCLSAARRHRHAATSRRLCVTASTEPPVRARRLEAENYILTRRCGPARRCERGRRFVAASCRSIRCFRHRLPRSGSRRIYRAPPASRGSAGGAGCPNCCGAARDRAWLQRPPASCPPSPARPSSPPRTPPPPLRSILDGNPLSVVLPAGIFDRMPFLTQVFISVDLFPKPCPQGARVGARAAYCEFCGAGKFNAIPGAMTCESCPAGSFNPITASNSSSACRSCWPGTFNPEIGQGLPSACKSCTAGR